MSRQPIKGIQSHPEQTKLSSYEFSAPEGEWTARLDDRAWGKSANLFCYFTDLATGKKHRLSVFNTQAYRPYKEGPNHELLGTTYRVSTENTDKGIPKFLKAEPV